MRWAWHFVPIWFAFAFGALALAADDPPFSPVPQFIHELRAGRVTDDAITAHIAQRSNAVAAQCRGQDYERLANDEAAFRAYLVDKAQRSANKNTAYNKVRTMDSFFAVARKACSPGDIALSITDLASACKLAEARSELAKLTSLAANYRLQSQAATAVAGERFSVADRQSAERWNDYGKTWLDVARRELTRFEEICAKKAEPVANSLIGRWTSRIHGGAIETTLGTDGTLSARIVALNPIMQRYGYANGMEVLRGATPRAADSLWLAVANGGEYFVAQQPDRKPNEPYGTPRWVKPAITTISRKKPNELELPATLSNRLSNYDPWVRDTR